MIAVCSTGFVKNIVPCGGPVASVEQGPTSCQEYASGTDKTKVKSRWQLGMYPAVRHRSDKLCVVRLFVALFVCIRYCVLVRCTDTCTVINMFGSVLLLFFSTMFRPIVTIIRVSYNKNSQYTIIVQRCMMIPLSVTLVFSLFSAKNKETKRNIKWFISFMFLQLFAY